MDAPLHLYTQKGVPFVWSPKAELAFKKLKEILRNAPVLAYPHPAATFILDTDASNEEIGAVLPQVIDGKERSVAFFSQTLNQPQQNYCVTRRELLAVIKSLKQFMHIHIDSNSLYALIVQHCSGSSNSDTLRARWQGCWRSIEAPQQAQITDDNLKLTLEWLQVDATRPLWEEVASFSEHTKAY